MIRKGIALAFLLGCALLSCGKSRAKYAPPDGEPEPPEGKGWYCFHATSPHNISVCTRKSEHCQEILGVMRTDKEKEREVEPSRKTSRISTPQRLALFGDVEPPDPGGEEPAEGYAPAEPNPEGQSLEGICEIDPSACSYHERAWSIPTYSSCAPLPRASCSAYYHEFNYYRKDEETRWGYMCTENEVDCQAWRELSHLHLVKRPCVPLQ